MCYLLQTLKTQCYLIVGKAVPEDQLHIRNEFFYTRIVGKVTTPKFTFDGSKIHWMGDDFIVVWYLQEYNKTCVFLSFQCLSQ